MTTKTNKAAEEIGHFFLSRRLELEISIEDAANYSSISIEQLGDYEAGRRPIPFSEVFALSNLYSIPPDEVVKLFYEVIFNTKNTSIGTG